VQVRVFGRPSTLDGAAAIRDCLKGRKLGDVVAVVRTELDR
jgi:hypothetical protein